MPAVKREGATLLEIVAVLGIIAVTTAAIGQTLARQQRLYRFTSEQIDTRRSVRDALGILAGELRGASVGDTVRLMSDSAVEFFSTIGTSVACTTLGPADLGLAPPAVTGVGATSWLTQPDTGDFALIYRAVPGGAGAWERYRIKSLGSRVTSTACPVMSGPASGFAASASSYVLSLATPPTPPTAIRAGSPVRFVRRGRYSLYKSSDGKWYLGYRRCNALGASVCGSIQPLSGYYRSYSSDTTRTGLLFRYFDAANAALSSSADPLQLARIQISARALSAVPVTLDAAGRSAADTGRISAAFRNE
jgi:type II secretory pathway pseudopilin PulG